MRVAQEREHVEGDLRRRVAALEREVDAERMRAAAERWAAEGSDALLLHVAGALQDLAVSE